MTKLRRFAIPEQCYCTWFFGEDLKGGYRYETAMKHRSTGVPVSIYAGGPVRLHIGSLGEDVDMVQISSDVLPDVLGNANYICDRRTAALLKTALRELMYASENDRDRKRIKVLNLLVPRDEYPEDELSGGYIDPDWQEEKADGSEESPSEGEEQPVDEPA
jgi:hypothetical protein